MSSVISNTVSPLSSPEIGPSAGPRLEEDTIMVENLPHSVTDKLKDMEISPPSTTPFDGEEKADEIEATTPVHSKPLSLKDILKKTLQKKEKVQQAYLEAMSLDIQNESDKLRDELTNLEKHEASSWENVKSVFAKKFGTVISKLHKKKAVMTMTIEDQKTLDEYSIRFFRTAGEAGYNRDDLTLGDVFLLSLPDEWQLNISTVLLSRTHQHTWTPTEISTFALNLLGERTPASWYASKNNNGNEGLSKRKSYKKSVITSNISASGSASGSGVESLPKARMLGERNIPNKATKNATPCRHCGKPWKHGHTCDEYRNAKRQKSASVLSVPTSSDIKEEDESGQLSQTMKELYENESYPSDYGTPSKRKELLTLIQPALDKNIAIPSNAACTMPESVVKIKITNPNDCFVRQYPLAINAHAEIKVQLEQWLKDGIVEKTKPDPTFHSPLLAVPKRDPFTGKATKLRICCDLRRINAAISNDDCHENFAIPKIQEIFGKVSGRASIISVLDLKQAYFAYPVSPESRRCLIFSYDNITYQWARAPFGLKFLN
ncbi:hypothetical protein INT46_006609 [Mucor plumbeus]|uniref:Reverse transcriptase domain-containing protein n=1 Tax=Mucor plumbeus TaxID=97098 RepID=A0A8H7RPJ2_9FUNG|nr:hypothetical protein INT46_006609 [Mucor plumbeus]